MCFVPIQDIPFSFDKTIFFEYTIFDLNIPGFINPFGNAIEQNDPVHNVPLSKHP